jgi:uncharacterized membrane protein
MWHCFSRWCYAIAGAYYRSLCYGSTTRLQQRHIPLRSLPQLSFQLKSILSQIHTKKGTLPFTKYISLAIYLGIRHFSYHSSQYITINPFTIAASDRYPYFASKKTDMEFMLKLSLWTHILAGSLSLLAGAIAIASKKGQKVHRLNGKIYFWAMITVVATALFISIFKDIQFLLLIAIFSLYMTYTGYRIIKSKNRTPNIIDWALAIAALATIIFMFITMNVILLVFGVILGTFVVPDILRFLNLIKIPKAYHLTLHIGRMMGSFIATFTAFIVVNVQFHPAWVIWLAPTAVGSVFISYFIRKYGVKKKEVA